MLNAKNSAPFLLIAIFALAGASIVPAVSAYGNTAQWQIGFSGTCNSKLCSQFGGNFGFWGWCTFGGSSGSTAPGTTGTTADCQFTTYGRSGPGSPENPIHVNFDVTSWLIGTGSPAAPGPVPTFFFTGGSFEVTGPGASVMGIPTGVVLPLSIICDFSNIPASLIGGGCDTGLPSIPGHYSFHPFPGSEFNIQVNKLP